MQFLTACEDSFSDGREEHPYYYYCCIIRLNEHKSGSEKSTKIRAFYRQTIILEYSPTSVSHVSSKQEQTSRGKHRQAHTKITQI